jgi:hypothetical protein
VSQMSRSLHGRGRGAGRVSGAGAGGGMLMDGGGGGYSAQEATGINDADAYLSTAALRAPALLVSSVQRAFGQRGVTTGESARLSP